MDYVVLLSPEPFFLLAIVQHQSCCRKLVTFQTGAANILLALLSTVWNTCYKNSHV